MSFLCILYWNIVALYKFYEYHKLVKMEEGDILMEQLHKGRQAFTYAFPIMAPMGISLFVIGLGFGLYAISQGLPWWTAPVLAATIFAGSMEFVTIGMLVAGFDPINAFILTMFVNGRHFFYGLSALQRYIHMGWKWFPTVAWMCDESFAINMGTKLPDDVDEKWFYFHVSWLNYIFWVFSTFIGGLFGNLLANVDLRGIDFVLPPGKQAPDFVLYLGKALPTSVMGMLVVYTFKETVILSYPYGIPELIALIVTVGLHLWKRNMLVSIGVGTVVYMILIQAVFNVPK